MRFRQCGVIPDLAHACTGDATHGQFEDGPKVCANFVVEHKKKYPSVAHTWVRCGRLELVADDCRHERVTAVPCDQTLAVACLDCGGQLACCWQEQHVPESLWNRACLGDTDAKPCEQNRDDVCAICGEPCAAKLEEK